MDTQNQPHQQTASPPPATVSDISSYQAPPQPQQQYQPQYQQQQPTYVQPAMPPVPMTMRSPRLALYSKGNFNTKIVLRSFDLAFSIILIALAVSLLFVGSGGDGTIFLFIFGIPIGGLGFIWETAEFITICARGGKLGIHPGAHVGMHLVIWLLSAVGLGFAAAFVAYDDSYSYRYRNSWRYYYGDPGLDYATLAFIALLLIIHFTLFVMACVETHKANQHSSTVYLVQPDGQMVPMAMSMPMPMVQQPMPAYAYAGQQPMRQSTYSMAPAVTPMGAEPKGQAGEPGLMGNGQQRDSMAAPDGTYYGQGNGYGQQR